METNKTKKKMACVTMPLMVHNYIYLVQYSFKNPNIDTIYCNSLLNIDNSDLALANVK